MAYTKTPKGCGTTAGYQRHRYRKEDPCPPCLNAWADYHRPYPRSGNNPAQARVGHGTRTMYQRYDCRCFPCRRANADREFARRSNQNRRPEKITIADCIADVLETRGHWIPTDLLIDLVLDLHPEWKVESIRKALIRGIAGVEKRDNGPNDPASWRYQEAA